MTHDSQKKKGETRNLKELNLAAKRGKLGKGASRSKNHREERTSEKKTSYGPLSRVGKKGKTVWGGKKPGKSTTFADTGIIRGRTVP